MMLSISIAFRKEILRVSVPPCASSVRLERRFESKLQNARIVRRGNRSVIVGAAVADRGAEVGAVEQVERLEAELEVAVARPRNGEALRRHEIHLPMQRTAHAVAWCVAERLAGIGRRRHSGAAQPVVDIALA